MNKLQERIKLWMISHIKHPELLTESDNKAIDFILTAVPEIVGLIIGFSIMSAIYLFLLKKYGIEKTMVILMINLIFAIGEVRKAIKNLMK